MWNSYTKFILHFLQTLSKTTEMFRKLRVMASALKRLLLAHNLFLYEGEKSSSKSSPNGHSRKRTALHMATFRKPCFSQPPMIQALYFYIPINSHLQLQTPFLHPKGVCLLEFACFLSLGQQFYNKMEKKVLKSYPFGCLNSLFVKS